jgi:hypothetical protein
LDDRVRIERRDAGDPALAGTYDLVVIIASLHDMTNPVAALRAMRRLAGAAGVALVAEGRTAERFLGEGTDREMERWFYGFSVLHCLPVSMAEPPAAGTGTAMRPGILRGYAREAGFRGVEIFLPVDDPQTALYRLLP